MEANSMAARESELAGHMGQAQASLRTAEAAVGDIARRVRRSKRLGTAMVRDREEQDDLDHRRQQLLRVGLGGRLNSRIV